MTPAEDLRAARVAIGKRRGLGRKLTQAELAEALGMGKHGWQSVSSWETGKTPIPGPVGLAIRCMLEHGE